MKLTLFQILSVFLIAYELVLTGCSKSSPDACAIVSGVLPDKETVLVIGDSISLGYTPDVKALVQDPNVQVLHTDCNSMSSSNGASHIDAWLSFKPHWHTITINHGYWDMPGNAQSVDLTTYANNLRIEVQKAKAVSDQVIFITSTAIIPAYDGIPGHFGASTNATVQYYNNAALVVMSEYNVPVIDLYTTSLSIPDRVPDNLHFTPQGYMTLAEAVYLGLNTIVGIK